MMDQKLKIAIIGCGSIAHAHMNNYVKFEDVEVVAAADIVPGKAETFLREYGLSGARAYTDHAALLAKEQPDAVSVCTYNRQHKVCAIDAMRAGADVLLEKPMSVTLEEAIEMMRVEKETGKILSIGFQPRFSKNMQQIKKIVDSGVLGKIYYIQTGGGRRRGIPLRADGNTFIRRETAGIGALGDIGCYSLDMVLHAIGYPRPLSVDGCVSDYFGKSEEYYGKECASLFGVDDFSAAFIRLEGGVVLDFRIAWAMNIDSPGDTILLGTRGGLRIPATDCWNGSIGGPMTLYTEIAGQQVETKFPMFEEDPYSFFEQKIRSFLDAVKTRSPAPVATSEIIYNQAIIDGISRSAAAGHAVTIEVPGV